MTQGNSIIRPSYDALFVSLLSILIVATAAVVAVLVGDILVQPVAAFVDQLIELSIEIMTDPPAVHS